MLNKMKLAVMGVLAIGVVACSNQDAGVLAGGALGGALGNQIGGGNGKVIATIGGTLLGAYLGGSVGASMDKTDQLTMNRALESQPTNREYSWKNPDSQNHYTVRPTKTYYQGGRPCREFTTTAIISGKAERIKGHACRRHDGTWEVVQQ